MDSEVQDAFDFALWIVGQARALGYEVKHDGAQVFGRVPHVAPLAWLHQVYPPLHERDILRLERRLNRQVPDDYRGWLRRANGFDAFSGRLVFYGQRTDYSRDPTVVQPYDLSLPNLQERLRDADKSAFFFGSLLHADYKLFMVPISGVVHACARRSAIPMATWESLSALVTSVMSSLDAVFDGEGHELRKLGLR